MTSATWQRRSAPTHPGPSPTCRSGSHVHTMRHVSMLVLLDMSGVTRRPPGDDDGCAAARAARPCAHQARRDRTSGSKLVLRVRVGSERLGDEPGVHVLANLLDQALLESKDPAVVVVVPPAIGHLVTSRVLHHL